LIADRRGSSFAQDNRQNLRAQDAQITVGASDRLMVFAEASAGGLVILSESKPIKIMEFNFHTL
jgi:hypothetical protein